MVHHGYNSEEFNLEYPRPGQSIPKHDCEVNNPDSSIIILGDPVEPAATKSENYSKLPMDTGLEILSSFSKLDRS